MVGSGILQAQAYEGPQQSFMDVITISLEKYDVSVSKNTLDVFGIPLFYVSFILKFDLM